jgi:hypothetical protein
LTPARASTPVSHRLDRERSAAHDRRGPTSPGRFEGSVLQASLGSVALLHERTDRRLRDRFVVPAGERVVAALREQGIDAR